MSKATGTINRIDSLDYLRGLAAFSIMIYHMHLFTFGELDSSEFLAKVKIYSVSIFYVLSGLTLYLVSVKRFKFEKRILAEFYVKRFFRIVPLLWMATALTMLVAYEPSFTGLKKLVANITIIPGALKPETFIANGAWSIGDEIFFYILFPFLMLMAKANKWYFYAFTAASFAVLVYFSFKLLNPAVPLGQQWATYVNPLGQVFYFATGISLGIMERDMKKFGWWAVAGIIVIAGLIIYYPVTGEPVHLVTGYTRIVLSVLVASLCFLFYKCDFSFLPGFVQTILRTLGEVSYSIYLLHPIIYATLGLIGAAFFKANPYWHVGLTIALTLILGYLSYTVFEKYFINQGKKVSAKVNPKPEQPANVTAI
jgi:exopolysaccharide production protein ExoZ